MSDDQPTVTVAVDVSARDASIRQLNVLIVRRKT